ncbi:MAG: carbohydrate-binding family 9-like protein [Acidobacteriota bacterium]|nr:carbohydrate-binding family 9-like protein [Acidobacteriota bacterium]
MKLPAVLIILLSASVFAMGKSANIKYIETDFEISDLENAAWDAADTIKIKSYWSGQRAPKKRRFTAKMLWSESALYVRFDANQGEPLVISEKPDLTKKTRGLWDRDVCELFISPFRDDARKYFEFEVAPTGEWIDLGIYQGPEKRDTDWDYASGMTTAAKIEYDLVVMAFRVEWTAFGSKPAAGDVWKGNLLRAVGKGENRGYLAWSATRTEVPNFHVPERFGEFFFVRD